MAEPSYFLNDSAVISRTAETPDADWAGGCNVSGSNAHGVGINYLGGAVVGEPQQFTLLSQFEQPRTPQVSQSIGGDGYTPNGIYPSSGGQEGQLPGDSIRVGTPSASGDGTVAGIGNATLTTLNEGWVAA